MAGDIIDKDIARSLVSNLKNCEDNLCISIRAAMNSGETYGWNDAKAREFNALLAQALSGALGAATTVAAYSEHLSDKINSL